MARTRVRWTRVGSLALVGGLVAAMVPGRLSSASGQAGPRAGRPGPARVYVVRPGDTLWAIAAGLVGGAGDPRPVVDRLVRLNHVRDGLIRPGQELVLAP